MSLEPENWGSNPDSVPYILYSLGNFLVLPDEETSLLAHSITGKMKGNARFLLNEGSVPIQVLFEDKEEWK